jgi:hypothetical protein
MHAKFVSPKKRFTLLSAATAGVALGVGVAWASGAFTGPAGERAARESAVAARVAGVRALAASAEHASVVVGQKDGRELASIVVGSSSTPFVFRDQILARTDLALRVGSGGAAGSVEWLAIAGLVSPRVSSIEIESADGSRTAVALTDGSFAVDVDPASQAAAVVAFGANGDVVARKVVLPPAAPDR